MNPLPGDDDDPLRDLAQELRASQGAAELRAEAEENERLAAQAARRRATLADVARSAMFRGDRIACSYPGNVVTGEVVHAAGDLATVATSAGTVHCNLAAPLTLHVVERDVFEGRAPERGAGSFRARLYELELAGTTVEVFGAMTGGSVRGRIEVVATDHAVVAIEDGAPLHVSLTALHAVAEPAPR